MPEFEDKVAMEFYSIKEHFIYSGNLAIFMQSENIIFKDKKERNFDRAEVALLSNSFWNLKYCIDVGKYFLNLSLEENVKKLTRKKPEDYFNIDEYDDFIRALEHIFLIPSIIFYNASFDYFYISIFSLLTTRKQIIDLEETKIDKIKEETKKLGLLNEKHSWMFALNSIITYKKKEIRPKLEKKINQFFNSDFIKIKKELNEENKKLRINYYANIIKHQQIPFFKPICLDNLGGAKSFVDLNQFYSDEALPSIIGAIPEIVLDIEKTQSYLLQYHNKTVEAFNCILDKICQT